MSLSAVPCDHLDLQRHIIYRKLKAPADFVHSCRVEISLAMHPFSLFCPVSLVVARALAVNAFQASFATFDELSNTPLFEEHVSCIRLPWKKELIGQAILPLGYSRFWGLWTRTVKVAGFPDGLRPYSMRVGAGSRLDGMFTPRSPGS